MNGLLTRTSLISLFLKNKIKYISTVIKESEMHSRWRWPNQSSHTVKQRRFRPLTLLPSVRPWASHDLSGFQLKTKN